MSHNPAASLKVLAFDVFGTVVDWHGTIAREVNAMQLGVDGGEFALAWRAGYKPAMQRVMRDGVWEKIDNLHRGILDGLLEKYSITHLDEAQKRHLNKVWHRLDPWADTVRGLSMLKSGFMISSLSNGNMGLLADMAKKAGLPWDCILSAEIFRKYKPDPGAYLGVAEIFDVLPSEVMLVATHQDDLAAARACGLRTAYVERPMELGDPRKKDDTPHPDNTYHAKDFVALAGILGCDTPAA